MQGCGHRQLLGREERERGVQGQEAVIEGGLEEMRE